MSGLDTAYEKQFDGLALSLILALVEPVVLARAQAVCRHWRAVAASVEVRTACFIAHWRLKSVKGEPRQANFFEAARLTSFVRRHAVQRTDTLQMLAVKYNSSVMNIKRTNNLISDYSLYSRKFIFVPVNAVEEVHGAEVVVQYNPSSGRDLGVLGPLADDEQQGRKAGGSKRITVAQIQALKGKLGQMLGRSLHIDEDTAKFYLEDAEGDVKAAMEQFEADLLWEDRTAGPIRKVPIQRWIEGHVGF